jgi:F0F1-type ATP synthase epsilon subunit
MSVLQIIEVCIKTAETTLFQGPAPSISSVNDTGPFDILSFHENFITLIQKHIVISREGVAPLVIPIQSQAVMQVESNRITIFLGIEVERKN